MHDSKGNKKWFQSIGISPESIVEMDWWEKKDMYFDARGAMVDGETDSIGSLRISCVPAQHNSGEFVYGYALALSLLLTDFIWA